MDFKSTITFDDARRIAGPKAFNLMIKPAGSLCNLDCKYCYYLDKAEIYGGKEPRMSLEMLRSLTRLYIEANDVPEVSFNWHGGEPLVLGLDFYRKAVEFQKEFAGGKTVHNTLQTNGTLLTPEWADFLRENNFLVGISLDGPEDVHNRYRRDRAGGPTFDKVMRGVQILSRHGVQFNTMSTVNKACEGRGREIYSFFKSIGSHYMQFMPVVEHVVYPLDAKGRPIKSSRPHIVDPDTEGAVLAPWSIDSLAFGTFLCDIFDEWLRCGDVGKWFVGQFDATLALMCGVQPGTCSYAPTCGGNSVVEHNGDVYCCDHFVYPKYKLGNILETDLRDMMASSRQIGFGIAKRNALPQKCQKCEWLRVCWGECPKHRFNTTEKGQKGLSALCEGYRKYFAHTQKVFEQMKADIIRQCPDTQSRPEL